MQNRRGLIIIASLLVLISLVLYIALFLIFNNAKDIFFYTLLDLAFLPLQVLIVGIVIERIMVKREIDEKISKLNMVVGTFFSEVGHPLSAMFLNSTPDRERIIANLAITPAWKTQEYVRARKYAEKDTNVDFTDIDLDALKSFLTAKRQFLLTLIENPNLLEHERFTDLLLASFHLAEELESRPSLAHLPASDIAHLKGDINRAYRYLVIEWLDYMQHVQSNYPFLYSHYVRTHPFQAHPSAVIE
ncbi:MAG: hypothetical protein NTV42_06785 [Chloroflexi bacterium]|nr:hypothetical protein [Chloroflexota bacterium]